MDRVQAMQKVADIAVGSKFENLKMKLRAVFGANNFQMLEKPFPHYCIASPDGDDDIIVAHSKDISDPEHKIGDVSVV